MGSLLIFCLSFLCTDGCSGTAAVVNGLFFFCTILVGIFCDFSVSKSLLLRMLLFLGSAEN